MNKLPRNRLDDTLNAILIAVGVAALLSLAIGTPRNEPTLARAPATSIHAKAAPSAVMSAGAIVASVQAPAAR